MTWHPSLGESAFVDLARREVLSMLTKDLWEEVGGKGQVQARFKSSVQVGARFLSENARFHVSLFVNRPETNSARVALAVRLEPTRGMTKEETTALRDDVAEDLRRTLAESPLGQHRGKQSTVASIGIPVNAGEGDSTRAAEAVLPRLQKALGSIRAVERTLQIWCSEQLPRLLKHQGEQHAQ